MRYIKKLLSRLNKLVRLLAAVVCVILCGCASFQRSHEDVALSRAFSIVKIGSIELDSRAHVFVSTTGNLIAVTSPLSAKTQIYRLLENSYSGPFIVNIGEDVSTWRNMPTWRGDDDGNEIFVVDPQKGKAITFENEKPQIADWHENERKPGTIDKHIGCPDRNNCSIQPLIDLFAQDLSVNVLILDQSGRMCKDNHLFNGFVQCPKYERGFLNPVSGDVSARYLVDLEGDTLKEFYPEIPNDYCVAEFSPDGEWIILMSNGYFLTECTKNEVESPAFIKLFTSKGEYVATIFEGMYTTTALSGNLWSSNNYIIFIHEGNIQLYKYVEN